ncbi:hypothetical protein SDRG_09456 [Saprolegnia diclina VS20]|uniref:Uncharacterized protein n=1 Tax=Saprolegnia diclina (strain VS20) TaxID=1156394 RepID=T0QDX1_SAPDV|nr:hypothetical protein SDRG_09456 [Saprolegnia diclina VS20]EQC32926.1 hypothetical protein SDRG_09456 [Saprolegnia diclina VS20]|eukprot:XP_008613612.1 hypothetical protein SDRG_09456 [Saprolegnia diclina VS20]
MPKKAEVLPAPTHLRRQFHARKNTTPLKTEAHSTAFATQPPSLASCSLPTAADATRQAAARTACSVEPPEAS